MILQYARRVLGSGLFRAANKRGLSLCRMAALSALLSLIGVLGSTRGFAQGNASGTVVESPAESAVRRLVEGNFSAAAQHLRQAMEVTPDDAVLNIAAGAVAVSTGDVETARSAFEHALHSNAQDSLALYGLGLARLAKGDRAGALNSFDRSESAGGDRAYLLLARRYTQWLAGAQVSVAGAGLTEQLAPSQNALQAMQAEREGNWQETASLMVAVLNALPGDPMLEPGGVLMNFDPAHAVASGAARLPAGSLTVSPDKGVLTGSVEVSPEGSLDGVAFVSYELDSQPLGFVNVRPFAYTWDTRRAKNGQHTLTVILHDQAVNELGRTNRKVRVVNFGSDASVGDDEQNRLRTMLWQALALRPCRCSGSYYLGLACRAMGQIPAAQVWFARCIAIQPDYRDARRQWAACGGLAGEAGSALWGGLTSEKVVALTFDDGPKPGVTEPLLDVLRQERVPATFFVIGRHVMEYPELTKQLSDAGMEIANHSYTHRNLTRLTDADISREVMQTQAAIQSVTGRAPRFLRPPGGNWNPRVAQTTRSWGLTPCMWTVDVYGSEVIGAQQVADAVLAQVRPGSIILMHNGKVSTLQALPTIIRALRSRGYAFATIDTMERRLGSARAAAKIQPGDTRQRIE
jgi:peptidoglycan/xylan/chitin deacetylase (PgdA/CDA1 family)/Tfp pilus assembly protein PilF